MTADPGGAYVTPLPHHADVQSRALAACFRAVGGEMAQLSPSGPITAITGAGHIRQEHVWDDGTGPKRYVLTIVLGVHTEEMNRGR